MLTTAIICFAVPAMLDAEIRECPRLEIHAIASLVPPLPPGAPAIDRERREMFDKLLDFHERFLRERGPHFRRMKTQEKEIYLSTLFHIAVDLSNEVRKLNYPEGVSRTRHVFAAEFDELTRIARGNRIMKFVEYGAALRDQMWADR